jgi:photosystem II stability/assembly factor-like uncharacterized protein
MRLLVGLSLLILAIPIHAQWVRQAVDTAASFRGLAVVNEKVVWASGTGGTVIRTIDGGKTWNVITVPGAEKLDFRDIEAFDANTAYILSIGNGDLSRIYKTTDGGQTWTLQFKNNDPKKFFDAIACPNSRMCMAVSDPIGGRFPVLLTADGEHWASAERLEGPEAADGEAAFAASGTCLIALGPQPWFLVSGGARASVYMLFLGERGQLVTRRSETPIANGSSGSGIFSIAMFDPKTGVIVGGNYEKPDGHDKNLAFTRDLGRTWKLGTGLTGYRSGVTYVGRNTIIAVGTNGSDITRDGGNTWTVLGKENLNAVASKGPQSTWAVGPKGMVVKLK